jgi:5-methylcytosine-specific restriction endonuclease McrA
MGRKRSALVATDTEVKEAVRLRDGMCCKECGMTDAEHVRYYGRTLDVHRINPGSEYTVDGCVTLCRMCHRSKPKSKTSHRDIKVKLTGDLAYRIRIAAIISNKKVGQFVADMLDEVVGKELGR